MSDGTRNPLATTNSERLQQQHYERIAHEYAKHYGDSWSERYRHRFMNEAMTEQFDLAGKLVLEAMSGSGETTAYLLSKGARVIALDISARELGEFRRRWPECGVICASILKTGLAAESLDAVVVVGGLHHVQPLVKDAVEEIHRVLKPGGHFCFIEPHRGSLPDRIRRVWYRRDRYFASNEMSIDVEELKALFADRFEFLLERYRGGLAYQLVLNSMIWRIPLWLKPWYAPLLIGWEQVMSPVSSRALTCFVVAQWRKRVPDSGLQSGCDV